MIRRNLGNLERLVRLVLGMGLWAWALMQPSWGLWEFVAIVAAGCLVANGVFSRCYAWYVLDINTADGDKSECEPVKSRF